MVLRRKKVVLSEKFLRFNKQMAPLDLSDQNLSFGRFCFSTPRNHTERSKRREY
jgi:hypothetical protein